MTTERITIAISDCAASPPAISFAVEHLASECARLLEVPRSAVAVAVAQVGLSEDDEELLARAGFLIEQSPEPVTGMVLIADLIALVRRLSSPASSAPDRDDRQRVVSAWCARAFGNDQASSIPQRALRLVEEAVEAAQAADCDPTLLHKLVDFVYARPIGTLWSELGGVGVTLLALAEAARLSADDAEQAEIDRVLALPADHFTRRNQAKNEAGFYALDGLPSPSRREQPSEELARLSHLADPTTGEPNDT